MISNGTKKTFYWALRCLRVPVSLAEQPKNLIFKLQNYLIYELFWDLFLVLISDRHESKALKIPTIKSILCLQSPRSQTNPRIKLSDIVQSTT